MTRHARSLVVFAVAALPAATGACSKPDEKGVTANAETSAREPSGDQCQRAIRKLAGRFAALAKHDGTVFDETARTESCRASLDDRHLRTEQMQAWIDQVLSASNEEELEAAWTTYMSMGVPSDGPVILKRIANAASEVHARDGRFPIGVTGWTPAKDSTCPKVERQPADWTDPIWNTLGVRVVDKLAWRYRYESDGKSMRVTAVAADFDCDGSRATKVLAGETVNGKPSLQLIDARTD